MDPISASCLNINSDRVANQIELQKKVDAGYQKILGSVVSISNYEEKSFKNLTPQILAAILVTSFHMVIGISLAYSAILIPQLEENPEFPVTKSEASWIASIVALSTPAGSMIVGFIMDRYGRLTTLKLATIPGLAAWIITAMSTNVPMLIIGRALIGFATAIGSNPAIVYLTEIARKDMRGSLISLAPALASLGMVLTFVTGWFMTWRQVAWLSNLLTVIPLVLVIFVPESPAWLVSKGRVEEAKKGLEWINKYQPQPRNKAETVAQLQLALLQKEHESKLNSDGNTRNIPLWREFLKPTGYKPMLILLGAFTFQQFSGIFVFLFYSINFFQEVGSTVNPYLASIFIGVLRLIVCLANTYILKKFRRRPLLMLSFFLMSITIFLSGLTTSFIKNDPNSFLGKLNFLPVVCLLLFVVASMIGVVPIPYTMTAELFPLEIRGVAQSGALCMVSFIMFVSLQCYQYLYAWCGGIVGAQYFFAGVAFAGVLYTWVFLPETHQQKLSEIEEYFRGNFVFIGHAGRKGESEGANGVEEVGEQLLESV